MKIVDIAAEVHRDLSSPSDLSIPAIAYWLRANAGALNSHINTCYVVNSTSLELEQTTKDSSGNSTTTSIGLEEGAILKKMYMLHYYELKIRSHIVAIGNDSIIRVSDGGSSVTKINKAAVALHLNQIKQQEYKELKELIHAYQRSQAAPRQVAGDDTQAGPHSNKYNTQFNRID
tara:strand:+ start:5858 stop:6382 length:525 start_codon:yes stop_codon:yes gene_type:complete